MFLLFLSSFWRLFVDMYSRSAEFSSFQECSHFTPKKEKSGYYIPRGGGGNCYVASETPKNVWNLLFLPDGMSCSSSSPPMHPWVSRLNAVQVEINQYKTHSPCVLRTTCNVLRLLRTIPTIACVTKEKAKIK
jgi:hypothetical protein